jgi:hypothetical protein
MLQSALYWLKWNEYVESVSSTKSKPFKIEELNPRELVKSLDLIESNSKVSTKPGFDIESVPTSLGNIRVASSGMKRSLSWEELSQGVGKELANEIRETSRRYGYEE